MNKIITDFTDIKAGWMNMSVYDYRSNETRQMRISYLQNFFDDLLMACKFLLSDITGIYEVYIDQEGFDATIRLFKYQDYIISVEIKEDFFEDELHYDGTSKLEEKVPSELYYFNVNLNEFVNDIIVLVQKYEKEYNEGFVLAPSQKLDRHLLKQVKKQLKRKRSLERRNNEKVSNT